MLGNTLYSPLYFVFLSLWTFSARVCPNNDSWASVHPYHRKVGGIFLPSSHRLFEAVGVDEFVKEAVVTRTIPTRQSSPETPHESLMISKGKQQKIRKLHGICNNKSTIRNLAYSDNNHRSRSITDGTAMVMAMVIFTLLGRRQVRCPKKLTQLSRSMKIT